MWQKFGVVFSLTLIVHGQDYGNLDTLGERISARVAAQVAPLDGLGDRINAEVQRGLRPMQVNLGSRLGELDGLGDRISQRVYQDLEPVRAIELNFKMRDGVGGVTVATHYPGGRQFIVKDRRLYTCSSQIDSVTGECSSNLVSFQITKSSPRSDWCYVQSYSLINNVVCMSTGGTSVEAINGRVSCLSTDNSPTIQIGLDDYKNLCSSVRDTTEFKYIPNLNDNQHVAIPNRNRHVHCENRQDNLCIFHEKNGLLSMTSSPGTAGVFIQHNNGNSVNFS